MDYDTYYRVLAYQRWLEEKKKRERRKRIVADVLLVLAVVITVYLSLSPGEEPPSVSNTTEYHITVPRSVKLEYENGVYRASFSVYFVSKPPVLVVSNYPYCSVDVADTSANVVCEFSDLESSPDRLSLYDGSNYYYVPLDKYAVASFTNLPGGGVFQYRKTVFEGDDVTVSFSVVSDRLLARPRVVAVGLLNGYSYRYTESYDSKGNVVYSFVVSLKGVRSSKVGIKLVADNLRDPLRGELDFNIVKRSLVVEKDFDEPVVVMEDRARVIGFIVTSNYDTTISVSVGNLPGVDATYVNDIPILKGQQNDVSISLVAKNASDIMKGYLPVIISDKFNERTFKIPVIVIPKLQLSIVEVSSNVTEDGSIELKVVLKSNINANATITYSSSPETYSPSFPMSIGLRKGLNSIDFVVKGYPPNAGGISITLSMDLFAYGVEITKTDINIRLS